MRKKNNKNGMDEKVEQQTGYSEENSEMVLRHILDYEKTLSGKDLEQFRVWRKSYTKRQQKKVFFVRPGDVSCTVCGQDKYVFSYSRTGNLFYFKCKKCDFCFKGVRTKAKIVKDMT